MVHEFGEHNGPVRSLVFSLNGMSLVTVDEACNVREWDLDARRQTREWQGAREVVSCATLAPDGRTVASIAGKGERLFVRELTSEQSQTITLKEAATNLLFSPDSKQIALISQDGLRIAIVDVAKRTQRWFSAEIGSPEALQRNTCLAWSPEAKLLAASGDRGVVNLWSMNLGQPQHTWNVKGWVGALAFSPDGQNLAVVEFEDQALSLWNIAKGTRIRGWAGASSVAFSRDGRTIASGVGTQAIEVWETLTGTPRVLAPGPQAPILSLAVAPDAPVIVTGELWGTIRLWQLAPGNSSQLREFDFSELQVVDAVCFDNTGRRFAAAGPCDTIIIGHRGQDETVRVRKLRFRAQQPACVYAISYSPDGTMLASGGDDEVVRLWDVAAAKVLHEFTGHRSCVRSVAFSPDGRTLASATDNGAIRLWDLESGKERRALLGHDGGVSSIHFCRDGTMLASGGDDQVVRVWDVATGKVLGRYTGHRDCVRSVAFSPDGRTLASGSEDGTVRLWDVERGTLRRTLVGHQGAVNCVEFDRSGRLLASASCDTTVLVWSEDTSPRKAGPAGRMNTRQRPELAALWRGLCASDGPRAYQAMYALVDQRDVAVQFLAQHVRPIQAIDPQRLTALVEALESENYETRTGASDELERLQDLAVPVLREVVSRTRSAEMRHRARDVLERLEAVASTEQRGTLRALEVLECIGSSDAKRTLEAIAKGDPRARLTNEAKASLERVAGRAEAGR
jgi:WD40 repeat protein